MKQKVESTVAPKATGPFSQAILTENLVFTSGQIALTPEGKLVEGEIEDQAHQVLKNLKAILSAADLDFSHVVKTTIYVTDMALYSRINAVYAEYFSAPFPARELVGVKQLPLGAQVEMSVVAVKTK